MPAPVTKRKATYSDVLAVPEHLIAELIDGELITSPRPANPHANATSVLGAEINTLFHGRGRHGGPGGWWIIDEPELHLGEDVLVPDLAGWRRERLPEVPAEAYFTLAPDWACEVVSPSTARLDRMLKLPRYARAQVGYAWIVNPTEQSIEAFVLADGRWVLHATFGGDQHARIPPFEQVELALADLWLTGAA